MTNVLILMLGSMLGQCGTECALVSVTPHDVSVAFAGSTGLSRHPRHFAPVRHFWQPRASHGRWYPGKVLRHRGWYPGRLLGRVFRGRRCR